MREFADVGKFGEESGVLKMDGKGGFDVGKRDNPGLKWLAKGSMYASIGSAMFGVAQGVERIIGLVGQIQNVRFEVTEFEAEEVEVAAEKESTPELTQKAKPAQEKKFELNLPVAAGSLQEACDLLAWEGMENVRDRDVFGRLLDVSNFYYGEGNEILSLDFLGGCMQAGHDLRSLMNLLVMAALQDESRDLALLVKRTVSDRCKGASYLPDEAEKKRIEKLNGSCEGLPTESDFDVCLDANGIDMDVKTATFSFFGDDPEQCEGVDKVSAKGKCWKVVNEETSWIKNSGAEAMEERCQNWATEEFGITRKYPKVLNFLDIDEADIN